MTDSPRGSEAQPTEARPRRKGLTGLIVVGVVFGMVGLSFAAVPLYRLFCEVTGFGGTTQVADAAPDRILDRTIKVQFDANIASTLPWSFQPEQRSVTVRLGEATEVAYRAENEADIATTGTAVFNVTPTQAGGYFMKISCFCFNEQTLAAGEGVDMPVLFYVDPRIADDPTLDFIDTITLSYTFYPATGTPSEPVALAPAPAGG
ncbi:MAG: cytochrome c oxidase assembly protein [Bauldia sp.]|nr:cytochrome c oxidase assembly protein [Bauldia sp.]